MCVTIRVFISVCGGICVGISMCGISVFGYNFERKYKCVGVNMYAGRHVCVCGYMCCWVSMCVVIIMCVGIGVLWYYYLYVSVYVSLCV